MIYASPSNNRLQTTAMAYQQVDIDRPDCFSGMLHGFRLWICSSPARVWSVQVWRGHQQLVHRYILATDMDQAKQQALKYAGVDGTPEVPPQP